MIPTWLQAHLEAVGRWNVDGVSRQVSAGTCPRCHTHVLRGLDADRCGLPITADPDPVDAVGELTAILTGRPTVTLTPTAGRKWQLNRRDQYQISAPREWPVLATHKCGEPLGRPETEMPALAGSLPAEPPF